MIQGPKSHASIPDLNVATPHKALDVSGGIQVDYLSPTAIWLGIECNDRCLPQKSNAIILLVGWMRFCRLKYKGKCVHLHVAKPRFYY